MSLKSKLPSPSIVPGTSRIEALVQVYDRLLMFLERAQYYRDQGDLAGAQAAQLESQRMILGLTAGINVEGGEVAVNVLRLLEFVTHQVAQGELTSALRIAQNLRDAYAAIAGEVEQLEATGVVPSLNWGPEIQVTV